MTENKNLDLDYTNNPLNIDTSDPLAAQIADFVFETVYVTGTRLTYCGSDYTLQHYQAYWVRDGLSRSVMELTENVRMLYPIIQIILTQQVRF